MTKRDAVIGVAGGLLILVAVLIGAWALQQTLYSAFGA